MIPEPDWRPIPEGDGDGSVVWTIDTVPKEDSRVFTARVILGGNGRWTVTMEVYRRLPDLRARGKGKWRLTTLEVLLKKSQANTRAEALQWAEAVMWEMVAKWMPERKEEP